jgi:hypothetical protein
MARKKRASGEGTIRKRPNGLWEARLSVPGQYKTKSFYGKTQADARVSARRPGRPGGWASSRLAEADRRRVPGRMDRRPLEGLRRAPKPTRTTPGSAASTSYPRSVASGSRSSPPRISTGSTLARPPRAWAPGPLATYTPPSASPSSGPSRSA